MKNIEKKWTLFLIATFVTFFGIINVIVKDTKANLSPANENFSDMNLYKCIIDTYNEYVNDGEDVDYTYNLSDLELAGITDLSCVGTDKEDDEKIVFTDGLNKLTGLINLDLTDNLIKEINLGSNLELVKLSIVGNGISYLDLSNNMKISIDDLSYDFDDFSLLDVIFVGDSVTMNSMIKLPNVLGEIQWSISDFENAKIDDGVLTSFEAGVVTVNATINVSDNEYVLLGNEVAVIELESEKYVVNNVLNSIFIGIMDDNVKNNIDTLLDENVSITNSVSDSIQEKISFSHNGYLLNVEYNDSTVKTFNVYGLELADLDVLFEGNKMIFSEVKKYSEVMEKISSNSDDIEIKMFDNINSTEETSSEYLSDGMILSLYYISGDDVSYHLYSYEINVNEFEFTFNVDVDEDNKIVYVNPNSTLSDVVILSSNISVNLYDKNGISYELDEEYLNVLVAGDKIELVLSNGVNKVLYTVVVVGDVNGDGQINKLDLNLMANEIIKGDILTSRQILSVDSNGDNVISIIDIIYWHDKLNEVQS